MTNPDLLKEVAECYFQAHVLRVKQDPFLFWVPFVSALRNVVQAPPVQTNEMQAVYITSTPFWIAFFSLSNGVLCACICVCVCVSVCVCVLHIPISNPTLPLSRQFTRMSHHFNPFYQSPALTQLFTVSFTHSHTCTVYWNLPLIAFTQILIASYAFTAEPVLSSRGQ